MNLLSQRGEVGIVGAEAVVAIIITIIAVVRDVVAVGEVKVLIGGIRKMSLPCLNSFLDIALVNNNHTHNTHGQTMLILPLLLVETLDAVVEEQQPVEEVTKSGQEYSDLFFFLPSMIYD